MQNHYTVESFVVMNLEITKVFLWSAVGDMVTTSYKIT